MKKEIKAMVLAAGVGSRLHPLSDVIPKPLIKIGGRPIMEHILLLLKKHGIKDVISNTYHLGEQIQEYFKDAKTRLGINIEFIHEEKLSGVAGGIKKCENFLKESTACIIMGDALTDLDLSSLYREHIKAVKEHNCLVTVAMMQVKDTSRFGVIVTESQIPSHSQSQNKNRIIKFQEKPKQEDALSDWANTGVYFFEPGVYDFIPSAEEAPTYDVAKDLFPKLLKENVFIQAIAVDPKTYWADIGTPEQYLQSLKDISQKKINLGFLDLISPEAEISEGVISEGVNEVGPECKIASGVTLKNSILMDGVNIGENTYIEKCIIGPRTQIGKNLKLKNQILIADKNYCNN
jgi:NDP-sugar pyrophosphorylase family protein